MRCWIGTVLIGGWLAASSLHGQAGEIFPEGAQFERLWNEGEFTEGVAVARDGRVYFSDIAIASPRPGRIMRFDPITGTTIAVVADSGQSNGLFFTAEQRLLAACGAKNGHRALCEVLPNGTLQHLAKQFDGQTFNAPNDLVVHPQGWVYFSDPRYVGSEPLELKHQSVYLYDPDGTLTRVTTNISKPNGVVLSPDARTLYVAETDNGLTGLEPPGTKPAPPRYTLNAFPIQPDGSLGEKKVLVDFGPEAGLDGMTVDTQGRIYAALRIPAKKGIIVLSPEGKELDFLATETLPTNCAFGVGRTANTLYVTAGQGLYRLALTATGFHPEIAAP